MQMQHLISEEQLAQLKTLVSSNAEKPKPVKVSKPRKETIKPSVTIKKRRTIEKDSNE